MAYFGKTITNHLHIAANDKTMKNARHLRKNLTEAEIVLWKQLKSRKLSGLKFRRQHPLHFYVADFYCHEQKLVIEVDGGIHSRKDQVERDKNRTAELERFDIRVIRFTNKQIINSMDDVLKTISDFVKNQPFK
jgi:very-short-patch-repair endonuclease